MKDLEDRISDAQKNREELESVLRDYLPFIRKQLEGMQSLGLEYDDMLSISMMVFVNCIRQYQAGKGGFLTFAQVSIRNRLIDEGRREKKNGKIIYLTGPEEDGEADARESLASIQQYEKERERQSLCDEIDALSQRLEDFGISISELARICPKQGRARAQCRELAAAVLEDADMRDSLFKYKKIPQKELAVRFHISPKTVEKHRKYIVALALLMTGDYPGIQAFLPQREKEVGM